MAMNGLRLPIVSFLSLTLVACTVFGPQGGAPTPSPQERAAAERDVYAVVKPEIRWVSVSYCVLVLDTSESYVLPDLSSDPELQKQLADVAPDTVEDYRSANASAAPLSDMSGLIEPCGVIRQTELDEIFGGTMDAYGGWTAFHEKYSSDVAGYLSVSRVGFNRDMSEALVWGGVHCGPTCGRFGLFLLRKQEGWWEFVRTVTGGLA